ncbi:hypothetical protein RZS08_13180, partial [Arthrospira platensis SPKY1]|nr:hypothetical protein [Arthrospira platensis SPKY1]
MIVLFGTQLDSGCLHREAPLETGIHRTGPQGLLQLLESALGLSGHAPDTEYLRLEAYRQTLRSYLEEEGEAFFAASFQADQFATAADLLARRDELRSAGWDFLPETSLPGRLDVMARLESRWAQDGRSRLPGFADRLETVLEKLALLPHPIQEVRHLEPWDLLPRAMQRLLECLRDTAPGPFRLTSSPEPSPNAGTDLGAFQQAILQRGNGQ